jgi:hypothetical protein
MVLEDPGQPVGDIGSRRTTRVEDAPQLRTSSSLVRVELRHCTDTSVADWLVNSRTPPDQLIAFGPAGYEAYARLRYLPDPSYPGQIEADAEIPDDHPLWISQARRALSILAAFTDTPDECYFCVWEGIAGTFLSRAALEGPMVSVPHRRYALFTGRLTDIESSHDDFNQGEPRPLPAFVWPADHRWCFANDIDPHWAGIGAHQAAIDRLVDDPGLDVVRARPDETPPAYR